MITAMPMITDRAGPADAIRRGGWPAMNDYLHDPAEIYRRSIAEIRRETDLARFPADVADILLRLIHACAMPEIAGDLAWSKGAAAAGKTALADGAAIFADGEMTARGIIAARLPRENEIICTIADARVPGMAESGNTTRAAAAVDLWRGKIGGSVVAIGTAPTALFRLLDILKETHERPAVVLGFPVGFIGAAESKQALIGNSLGVEFIALKGRKGGSAMAAAAVNALAAPMETESS